MNTKAQFSVEYLFVVGLALSVVLITAVVFFLQAGETTDEEQNTKVEIIANDLLSLAKSVYYADSYSKKTARYTIPTSVQIIRVTEDPDNALIFDVVTATGTTELTYYSDVPIQGIFPDTAEETQQITHFIVLNQETYVLFCTEEFGCE